MTKEELKEFITGSVCWAIHDFVCGDIFVTRATGFEFVAVSDDGRIALIYGVDRFPIHLFKVSDMLNHMTMYMNEIEEKVPVRTESTLILDSDLKSVNRLEDIE